MYKKSWQRGKLRNAPPAKSNIRTPPPKKKKKRLQLYMFAPQEQEQRVHTNKKRQDKHILIHIQQLRNNLGKTVLHDFNVIEIKYKFEFL